MEFESARWRPEDAADDAPRQMPMGKGLKPAQRRAPTQDQKKVRRELGRKTATDDSPVGKVMSGDGLQYYLDKEKSSPAKDWDMAEGRTMTPSPDSVSAQMSDSSVGASSVGGSNGASGAGGSSSTGSLFHSHPVLLAGYGHVCERHGAGPHSPDAFRVKSNHDRFPIVLCTTHAQAEGIDVPIARSDYERTASVDRAGDRECQACGYHGSPVLADTGPACRQCGSYSLKRAPHKPVEQVDTPTSRHRNKDDYRLVADGSLHVEATQFDSQVATSDGRLMINPGDSIRMPNGQTVKVNNMRRHETSGDHWYMDTDAGTTVVPWSASFQVVPKDTRQQSMPGYGNPGGNTNQLPGNPQNSGSSNIAGQTCPVCGSKGTLSQHGGKYACSRCGYTENVQGGMQFSDSPQVLNPRGASKSPQTAVARRAAEVAANNEGDTL